MESLVAQGAFAGVVDVVPAGLAEHMFGGNRAARPARLEAAGRAGVPQVIATSGFDMISCGPMSRRDSNDPLWQSLNLAQRALVRPDKFRVEARTTADEVAQIARAVGHKLSLSTAPAAVLVPLRGWSTLSVKGQGLYDPDADSAFSPALRETLPDRVALHELDTDLNSPNFARAMVDEFCTMIDAG